MISLAKALDEHLKEHRPEAPTAPIVSPFSTQPPTLSEATHDSPAERFKLEVGYDRQRWMDPNKNENTRNLLVEMEDLFRRYGVVKMHGDYHAQGLNSAVS